ncbi:dihydropteroate synthase [Wenzhouxiangella sp. XN24]|uniref:dihydropteroate synthase n=1 Tax=Wenzhouxiangella sp. XN24 TaxID=2713569 RepID=UPI0013EC8544|nr:dihydropteroate synthase [Wenzhouxiangella sp. XN24]NGX16400.1 dihydropteroate synthase [Wenzhouxiangella sp. XN24]
MHLELRTRRLALDQPLVMGVLNVTPDSFSDGGRFAATEAALRQARKLAAEGAGLLDIGGESTRPGAAPVAVEEELRRVLPVIEALVREHGPPLSIDTAKPEVMLAASAAGAELINDVRALRAPGALEAAAASGCAVCLMHMQGEPRTMQSAPAYGDVVEEVYAFLADRIEACLRAGIELERILVDPGFGFGKTLEHNLLLMRGLSRFTALGVPVLVGVSRKSMIGTVTGRSVEARVAGGLALAALAVGSGARIIRSHDVAETLDAVRMAAAVTAVGDDNEHEGVQG